MAPPVHVAAPVGEAEAMRTDLVTSRSSSARLVSWHGTCAPRRMRISRLLRVALCAVIGAQASLAMADEGGLEWRRLEAESGTPLSALALSRGGSVLALGSERGVWRGSPDASPGLPPGRQPIRGPVRDLAFLEDGSLLVATATGLHELRPGAPARRVEIGVGERARDVRRIAVLGDRVAVATGAGVFLATPDRVWRRLVALPPGSASLVVLHARGTGHRLYVGSGGSLWSVEWMAGQSSHFEARRIPAASGRVGAGEAVDLFVYAQSQQPEFSRVSGDRSERQPSEYVLGVVYRSSLAIYQPSVERWWSGRPEWPPGAVPRRYLKALERHWPACKIASSGWPSRRISWQTKGKRGEQDAAQVHAPQRVPS